jgi:hypothetical protein
MASRPSFADVSKRQAVSLQEGKLVGRSTEDIGL